MWEAEFAMDQAPQRNNGKVKDLSNKQVFTTGEAATVCRVSQQTIIRCFDSGRLNGFRVPGSKFRRIPRAELLRFMRDNSIPMDSLGETKSRILIVDDDEHIVELFVDVLEQDDRFEIETAMTGYDAGLLTASFHPDLIILDYMLPDINGNIVCERVRQNEALANTKIIIVSGVINQDEIQDLLDSGADGFVKKPFDIEEIIAAIGQMLAID